ncbi:hypothetical protein Vadar_015690 [Vaccinium darrowii]|uniref:Uncharacterized protein n=1 Tax=Vaccinium darrowii TaxID=229202 RepID=A0ACB7YE61_9ERIC|nr:hypothetical protein Vadar_015690 [Vaccinium darrowii]
MEKKKEDHHIQAVWFAAATLVVVACLKSAAVVSLVEQWRVWVFLTLNLLLLAILFTSTSTKASAILDGIDNDAQNKMNEREMGRKQCKKRMVASDEDGHGGGSWFLKVRKSGGDDDAAKSTSDQLSKEELNERVEAFIAMFRQQLVSDFGKQKLIIVLFSSWSKAAICLI